MKLTGSLVPPFTTSSGLGFSTDSTGRTRYFTINTESSVKFFEKIAIQQRDIQANMLGLYGLIPVGRDLKARFASLTTPAHLFSRRSNGCVWTPVGATRSNLVEFNTCPIEYNGEECPDAIYGTCLERIFGAGNKARDLMGTEEGSALVMQIMRRVMLGLGNSFSELVHFAKHPVIEQINSEGSYSTTPEKWARFYAQQMDSDCGGLITILDDLAAKGHPGHTVSLPDGDFDANENYTGAESGRSILDLLNALVDAAQYEFKQWIDYGVTRDDGVQIWPVIKLTSKLYRAYEKYLEDTYTHLMPSYQYRLTLSDGTGQLIPGALKYHNMAVTRWDEVGWFDNITGATSHRAAILAPGVLGVAHDVDDLAQFDGMGMQFIQRLDAPWKGKIFMDTTLRWGAGIGDPDFITQAANISLPDPVL
ncbi:MAG: hypothetical protein KDC70_01185 [Saprospiraceae bacterium]|nr:hypothetical protein [Saprospiraceae bacterium]